MKLDRMSRFLNWYMLISFARSTLCANSDPETMVKLPQGRLVGIRQAFLGVPIHAYYGVPFAKPPVGALRFHAPQPASNWDGVLYATSVQNSSSCFGLIDSTFGSFSGSTMWNPINTMSEDCLNLNLWVPRVATHSKLPVMVWIYGGGFFSGSPLLPLYNGSLLAAMHNVIIVNINYRLGPFGFLFFGQGTGAPGNMGLLDQQMSLRWIQNNIHYFGGDPARVTIFGESAGAASVSAHLIAPDSRNLFQRGILQSGSILNTWATHSPTKLQRISQEFAKILNCNKGGTQDTIKCLQGQNPAKLTESSALVSMKMMEFAFGPVTQDERFFPEDVHEYLRRRDFKRCEILIGTMTDEGSFWVPYNLNHFLKFKPDQSNTDNSLSRLQYLAAMNETFQGYYQSPVLKGAIAFQYSNRMAHAVQSDHTFSTGLRDGISRCFSDFFFTCDVHRLTDILAEAGLNIYLYVFTQRSSVNEWPVWMGAMHGYEIEYIFGDPLRPSIKGYSDDEKTFSRLVMGYWTDFAKNGAPSDNSALKWPPYTISGKKYVNLNAQKQSVEILEDSNCQFWKELNSMNACHTEAMRTTSDGSRNLRNNNIVVFLSVVLFLLYL